MNFDSLISGKYRPGYQVIFGTIIIALIAATCFFATSLTGYQLPALFLLMAVSLMAMVFDIVPVLILCTLSALVWNFFFIPPIFTFHVGETVDTLMLLMYFLIALLNAVLMSRIRRAEKIARQKQERQNAVVLYNTLFNSLSHELKTPLSSILAASDTLIQNTNNLSEDSKMELAGEIEKAGMRLQKQIDNLLNMSRIESGMIRLHTDWCDLNELTYRIIGKFEERYPQKLVSFFPQESLPLYNLDGGLLEVAIENILLNAILYTPDKTEISIQVTGKKDLLEIIIHDNGPGFPKSEIQFAFEKFHRSAAGKTGGTGLGFSIAKGFIEAHKGSISLQNKTTGGALFTIQIPAQSSSLSIFKS